jgi:uncharacterized protein YaaR (DUF327 family)
MKEINSRDRLTPEDYLFLYWFENSTREKKIEYKDFQPTESLIKRYNDYIKEWVESFNNDRVHFEKPIDWDLDRKKTDYFKKSYRQDTNLKCGLNKNLKKRALI